MSDTFDHEADAYDAFEREISEMVEGGNVKSIVADCHHPVITIDNNWCVCCGANVNDERRRGND
jgi:hypothetical protein